MEIERIYLENDCDAIKVIEKANGYVKHGMIKLPFDSLITSEVECAIDYLCEEWDYCYEG